MDTAATVTAPTRGGKQPRKQKNASLAASKRKAATNTETSSQASSVVMENGSEEKEVMPVSLTTAASDVASNESQKKEESVKENVAEKDDADEKKKQEEKKEKNMDEVHPMENEEKTMSPENEGSSTRAQSTKTSPTKDVKDVKLSATTTEKPSLPAKSSSQTSTATRGKKRPATEAGLSLEDAVKPTPHPHTELKRSNSDSAALPSHEQNQVPATPSNSEVGDSGVPPAKKPRCSIM